MRTMWNVIVRRLVYAALIVLFCSCANGETIDLRPVGIPGSIEAPAGAEAMVEEFSGDIIVSSNDRFRIRITPDRIDVETYVQAVKSNSLNRFIEAHHLTEDELLFESEISGNREFHFVVNISLGEKTFHCKEDETEVSYSLDEAKAMLESCKSLAN